MLILDEPTSVLTPQEAEKLFETLETLRGEGRAVLYISHHLEEVKRLCDRATILRLGKVVATCDPSAETARSLAALMVGAQIKERPLGGWPSAGQAAPRRRRSQRTLALAARRLASDLSLEVRGGEVVGVAGVAGNGQSELFAYLSGELIADRAEAIRIDDHAGRRSSTSRAGARSARRSCPKSATATPRRPISRSRRTSC